jgi:hypothetical protein
MMDVRSTDVRRVRTTAQLAEGKHMSYEDILKISDDGQWRVRLIADESPEEPYDDGQPPLLRLETLSGGAIRATHIMATGRPTDDDHRIENAAMCWGSPSGDNFRMFEKYLRAYYGTTQIETWYSGSYWYVTYDTTAWRAYAGLDPGATVHIDMNDYKAWCEGDCWGYAVERNVTWHRDDDPGTTMQTWEEEDSCWGYYGSDYARESALEAYENALVTQP